MFASVSRRARSISRLTTPSRPCSRPIVWKRMLLAFRLRTSLRRNSRSSPINASTSSLGRFQFSVENA